MKHYLTRDISRTDIKCSWLWVISLIILKVLGLGVFKPCFDVKIRKARLGGFHLIHVAENGNPQSDPTA